jgi:hypothetical protein
MRQQTQWLSRPDAAHRELGVGALDEEGLIVNWVRRRRGYGPGRP